MGLIPGAILSCAPAGWALTVMAERSVHGGRDRAFPALAMGRGVFVAGTIWRLSGGVGKMAPARFHGRLAPMAAGSGAPVAAASPWIAWSSAALATTAGAAVAITIGAAVHGEMA